MTDLEIAQSAEILPIGLIAVKIGIAPDALEFYGKYKAKLPLSIIDEKKVAKSKLVLVTAITPTPMGEGKTTVTIGLVDGLNKIGKKAAGALREPSLGPVFGMKGGAAGGGKSQVIPMEDINLHFTGDFSAIEKANNLLSAVIDNSLYFSFACGSALNPNEIYWKRVFDMNDRALRNIVVGLGGTGNGIPRQDGFNITAASEIMAILCLSKNIEDLKNRLGNIFVGLSYDKKPVFARDLNAEGAMAALLKDAIKPNLVQTLEQNPVIIHGGPFANIAHGTNSMLATKTAMALADYVITEAGFASDLGAEKFFDIKSRAGGLHPQAVVLVVTARALKYHGSGSMDVAKCKNVEALKKGFENMDKHIENLQYFGLPIIVAINKFLNDSTEEIATIIEYLNEKGIECEISEGWAKGGEGMTKLAEKVVNLTETYSEVKFLYDLNLSITEKVEIIAKKIYGAAEVEYSQMARKHLKLINELGLSNLPVCIAKTQKSLSDNPNLWGRPKDFILNIRDFEIAAGAGFIIPIAGDIIRMPGLPKVPAIMSIDIDNDGKISGLF